jgi:hypothetical protein
VVKVRVEKVKKKMGPGSRENKAQANEKKEAEDEATLRLLI